MGGYDEGYGDSFWKTITPATTGEWFVAGVLVALAVLLILGVGSDTCSVRISTTPVTTTVVG